MSETRSLTYVRQHLEEITDFVESGQERVIVTRRGEPAAVIVGLDDIEGLEETLEIMSDPELMAGIEEGEKAHEAGDFYTLEEVKKVLNFED